MSWVRIDKDKHILSATDFCIEIWAFPVKGVRTWHCHVFSAGMSIKSINLETSYLADAKNYATQLGVKYLEEITRDFKNKAGLDIYGNINGNEHRNVYRMEGKG
jgi:hypothetical protein